MRIDLSKYLYEEKLSWKDERINEMAINRLLSDMMKIADILGYNMNTLDIGNVGIETFKDTKSDQNVLMEVVYDKQKDMEFNKVEFQITKIYNAFIYGEQSTFWKKVILEKFEPQTQVDFMLLVSFIYMRLADSDNKETRIAEATTIISAILCKYI